MEDPAALSRGVGLNANDIAAPSRVSVAASGTQVR